MDELDEQLAALESEYEQGEVKEPEAEPEVEEVEQEAEPDVEAKEGEKPQGYKSYDEYIADGGDPDYYKGPKAFEQEYQRIQDNKELKSELKTIKEMSKSAFEGLEEWRAREAEKIRADLEAKLVEQKETADVDGALETQKQLSELDSKVVEQKREVHPVVKDFIKSNPVLDESSESFNAEFYDDMSRIQAKYINDLGGDKEPLTEAQLERCMAAAFEKTKALHPELERSPRNDRQGAQRQAKQAPKAPKKDVSKAIRDVKLNAANPMIQKLNENAASEIFDMLAEQYGEDAAKGFANKIGVGQ